jgi:anti-anti-sigma regulatory factor
MMRITHTRTPTEQRWTLCGQLTGAWVAELRTCFTRSSAGDRLQMVVDLSEVTFIDESGETLLGEMRRAGAQFVACGVDTKHLLKHLKAKGERSLRRFNAPRENTEPTKGKDK